MYPEQLSETTSLLSPACEETAALSYNARVPGAHQTPGLPKGLKAARFQADQKKKLISENCVLISSKALSAAQPQPLFKDTVSHLCQD